MGNPLRRLAGRLKHVRFSLATLLLLLLLLAACATTWVNRHPWEVVRRLQLPFSDYSPIGLPDTDEIFFRPPDGLEPFTWNSATGNIRRTSFLRPGEKVSAIARRKRLLATTDTVGTIRIWNLDTGVMQTELEAPSRCDTYPCISDDNEQLAWIGADGGIRRYRLSSGTSEVLGHLDPATKSVLLDFSRDGRFLQVLERCPAPKNSAGPDRCVAWRVIDCTTGTTHIPPEELFKTIGGYGTVEPCFTDSPDRVFAGRKCWVIESGEVIACPGPPSIIRLVSDPDFVIFQTSIDSVEVRSYDLKNVRGKVRHGLTEHGVGFILAPSTDRMSSCGYCMCWCGRPSATIWDLKSGLAIFHVPNEFYPACFTHNGTRIVGTTLSGEVQVWQERRTASSWGILGRPEIWITVLLLAAVIASIRRDRHMALRKPGPRPTAVA